MILVNTDYITGKELETLSIVKGTTIRAKHLGKDINSGLKMIVGGELTAYGELISEARAIATKRMVEEEAALGADGVINMRYATSNIMSGAAWCHRSAPGGAIAPRSGFTGAIVTLP